MAIDINLYKSISINRLILIIGDQSMAKIRVVIDCIDYQYQSIDKLVSIGCLQLTNRFHVAVRLFSNGSQRTSKCGKNISDVCHFFVLTTFWRPLWSITEQTHGNMESICFIQQRNKLLQLFISKLESRPLPTRKIKVVFVIRAVLWAEKLGWYLECCWSWKSTLEKLAVAVNTERHSIRILNERSV